MATPTNLPASFTTGAVLTAAQMNNLRGAFRILQIVTGSTTTSTASTSTTWVDTTLSATITPQATSSKILVVYSQAVYSNGTGTGAGIRLARNLPVANTVLRSEVDISYGTASGLLAQHCWIYLDSPNTTSAITYKTQQNRSIGANTIFTNVNTTQNEGFMLLCEVSA